MNVEGKCKAAEGATTSRSNTPLKGQAKDAGTVANVESAASATDRPCEGCEVCELATELAEERMAHAATQVRASSWEEAAEQSKLDVEWLLPGVAGIGNGYGLSSMKLIRHCLLDEPLDPRWDRPWDCGDLVGVTRTAEAAPEHHREKAQAALRQFREWLEPEHVEKADRHLAREVLGRYETKKANG